MQNTEPKEVPPTLSPRGTLELLLTILEIDPSQSLNQATLKNRGVRQNKHANKLLSYLALRSTTGTLMDDVLECRHDPAQLADLLRQRLVAACVRSGCTEEQVAFIGHQRLNPKELKERLAQLPLLRTEMKDTTKAGVFGCFSTLSDVLACRAVSPLALKQRLGKKPGESARAPARSPSPGSTPGPRPIRDLGVVESKEYKRDYIVDFCNGIPVRISVTFDRLLDSTYLERLGIQLIQEAHAMQGASHGEPAGPAENGGL
jgi:hypothetical protein